MIIIDYQFPLLILFFMAGSVVTLFLLRRPAGHRAWQLADLVWVLLGGLGALGAVLAGVYQSDSSQIERQIDVAYAAASSFDRDAARFRLRYCELPGGARVGLLCDRADFLSASTAETGDLPLFIAITQEVGPLQGLRLFGGDTGKMREMADAFDPGEFVVFTSRDDRIEAALSGLRTDRPEIAADYTILAQSYDELIAQVGQLKQEWEVLQQNAFILTLQIISICLISFAAPFRLGKSIVEIRDR